MLHDRLPDEVAAILRIQDGFITRSQIDALNTSDSARKAWTRRGLLRTLRSGVYVSADRPAPQDPRQSLLVQLRATQLLAPDAIAFETTAAVTWDLPVRSIPPMPEVARAPGSTRLTHCRVRRTLVPPTEITHRHGLATTDQLRTLVDVAASQPLPDGLITVDSALRRGVTAEDLNRYLSSRGIFPGSVSANQTIAAANPRSESPLESLSRGQMIQRNMPLPLCNVVIRFGGSSVRVDFLWKTLGVIGECDGKVKYTKLDERGDAAWREKRRGEWLEDLGFEIARWGYPEVADDGAVMEQRFRRAAERQRQNRWSLLDGVVLEMPVADPGQFWTP